MKLLVTGATGKLGSKVVETFEKLLGRPATPVEQALPQLMSAMSK